MICEGITDQRPNKRHQMIEYRQLLQEMYVFRLVPMESQKKTKVIVNCTFEVVCRFEEEIAEGRQSMILVRWLGASITGEEEKDLDMSADCWACTVHTRVSIGMCQSGSLRQSYSTDNNLRNFVVKKWPIRTLLQFVQLTPEERGLLHNCTPWPTSCRTASWRLDTLILMVNFTMPLLHVRVFRTWNVVDEGAL